MGIISINCAKNVWGSTKSVLKNLEYIVFEPKYMESLEKGFRVENQSIFQTFKNAQSSTTKAVGNDNLFKRIWKNLSGIGSDYRKINAQIKNIKAGSHAGKLTFWKSLGKRLSPIAKRMPLIGNLIFAAMEIPNIFRAFTDKDGGVGTGIAETGKTATKFAGFAAGAAIGTALFPGVGSLIGGLIGGFAGGWFTEKLVGKSFTEKKQEKEEKEMIDSQLKQQNNTANPAFGNLAETTTLDPTQNTQNIQNNTNLVNTKNKEDKQTANTNPFNFNPNTYSQPDFLEKDFMAMNAGLV